MTRYGKAARRQTYDLAQAHLRTKAQNETIIDLIRANGVQDSWSYSHLDEPGPVTLQLVPQKQWVIQADGSYDEQPYPTGATGL